MNKIVTCHGRHKSKRRKCPILDSEESDDDVQADKTRLRKRRVIHKEDSCGSRSEVGDTEIDAWETSSPTSKARPAASVSPPSEQPQAALPSNLQDSLFCSSAPKSPSGFRHAEGCLCTECDPDGKKADEMWPVVKTSKITDYYKVKRGPYSRAKLNPFARAASRRLATPQTESRARQHIITQRGATLHIPSVMGTSVEQGSEPRSARPKRRRKPRKSPKCQFIQDEAKSESCGDSSESITSSDSSESSLSGFIVNSDSSESILSSDDVILASVEIVHTPNCGRANNSKKSKQRRALDEIAQDKKRRR